MALDNFIPQVWAARLLYNLHKALVFAQGGVMNRDYEGDIQNAGDTVRINGIGAVTVSTYSKNVDIAAPQTLADAQTILAINQAKYFNFQIDDVDRAQQTPKVMDSAMMEAAYALANVADQYVAGLYTDIAPGNFSGSDVSPKTGYTAANVYEFLVDLGVILDNNNVPQDGRFCVVPPFVEGYLLKDLRFTGYGTAINVEQLQNGQIGRAARFDIMKSNNLVNVNNQQYKVIAGHPIAWSFADQISKVEAYRPPLRFADAMKGLHLYGAKVTRPNALACLVINSS